MTASKKTKQEKILDRVRALVAIADHPNTPPAEAETAMAMANSLMMRNAIDEAMARSGQTAAERRAPVKREVKVAGYSGGISMYATLRTILTYIGDANRCKVVVFYGPRQAPVVYGMRDDVEWVEALFTRIYFELVAKINPKWDDELGYDENVYNLKVAGFKWADINEQSKAHGGPDAEVYQRRADYNPENDWQASSIRNGYYRMSADGQSVEGPTGRISGSMISAYKRHCKKVGDHRPVTTNSHRQYREQFVEGFEARIIERIREMAKGSQDEVKKTTGADVALRDMMEDVLAAMYADYPTLSPEAQAEALRRAREAAERSRRERQEMLDAMTDKQRAAFYEREARDERASAKKNEKHWAEKEAQFDSTAHARGAVAAASIDLNRRRPMDDASATPAIGG